MKNKKIMQWLTLLISLSITLYLISLIVYQCDNIKDILKQAEHLKELNDEATWNFKPYLIQYIASICADTIMIVLVNIPSLLYFIKNSYKKSNFIGFAFSLASIYFLKQLTVSLNALTCDIAF